MEILGSLCFAFVFAFIVIAGVKGCAALLSSKPAELPGPITIGQTVARELIAAVDRGELPENWLNVAGWSDSDRATVAISLHKKLPTADLATVVTVMKTVEDTLQDEYRTRCDHPPKNEKPNTPTKSEPPSMYKAPVAEPIPKAFPPKQPAAASHSTGRTVLVCLVMASLIGGGIFWVHLQNQESEKRQRDLILELDKKRQNDEWQERSRRDDRESQRDYEERRRRTEDDFRRQREASQKVWDELRRKNEAANK